MSLGLFNCRLIHPLGEAAARISGDLTSRHPEVPWPQIVCSSAAFLHLAIWIGCTLNCEPNWLSVFCPRIASITTRALNRGLCCFLVVVIDLSLSTTPSES